MKQSHSLLITTLVLVSSLFASLEKPHEHSTLEIINDFSPGSQVLANMRIENKSGIPRAIYSPQYQVSASDPESMAREYLLAQTDLLHHTSQNSELKYTGVVETPGGYRVQFIQEFAGISVYKASIKISLNRANEVVFVMNGYQPLTTIAMDVKVSESEALEIAENYLGIDAPNTYENIETIIYKKTFMEAVVARQVTIVPGNKLYGDWEILIDARSGEIIRAEDKACYLDAERETGFGWVYDPDPITAARTLYGQPQFSDNGDQNSDSLNHYLRQVDLEGLLPNNRQYYLSGPFASISDFEGPFTGLYEQSSLNFSFTRDQPEFEAVNIYYHLNHSMAYLNDSLGFDVMPLQYEGGVQFDPHGLDGARNAHFLPSTGMLAFGSPTNYVDAGEDHSIILHELGHGIHHWITNGGISQVEGLSEGLGDYWAQSYTRSLGLLSPEDPQYDYFGQWGLQPYGAPALRVTNFPNHYPDQLGGEVHYDGQLWASSLMSIYDLIGRQATDIDCWEGISMTDISSNQVDAAFAFIQADRDSYAGANLNDIVPVFAARGYLPGPVVAAFDADLTAGTGSILVNFEDLSFSVPDPIISWEWDFNNDGIVDATEQNPQYLFSEDGAYTVSLLVSDGSNSNLLVKEDFISLNSGTLVYDGQAAGVGVNDYSGEFIYDKLSELNVEARYTNHFPASLIGFDAVFISLGNVGEMGTSGSFMNGGQLASITEYVSAGGNVYIEGGSMMSLLPIFGYSDYESFWNLFSIESAAFEDSEQPLGHLLGQVHTLGEDISFAASTQTNNWYLDHCIPGENGLVAFTEASFGNAAIQGLGDHGQKTFYLSYSLAKLVDGDSPNTRQQALLKIIEYFDLPLLAPNFSSSLTTGHAPLAIDFEDVSTSNPEITMWQWDFDNDGSVDSELQHPTWIYNEPGTYSVSLTIRNADTTVSILVDHAIEVFNGESSLHFEGPDNAVIVDYSPLLNMTEAMSIEAWIYPTGWGNLDAGLGRILDKGFIRFFLNKAGNSQFADSSIGLILKHQDGTLSKVTTGPNSIQLNEWQHVAMTYDGASSEIHIYINGIDRTVIHTPPTGPLINHDTWDLILGNNLTRSFVFDGRLDEIRIWDIAVTYTNLTAGMSSYLNGDEAGLMAYFKMNEANGDTLYDVTGNSHRGHIENADWTWGTDFVVPVGIDNQPALPIQRLVMKNYPNPFNPSTAIRYGLPSQSVVHIQIFDVRGVELQNYSLSQQPAGWYELEWNGRDKSGSQVSSGIYFCRIQTELEYQTIKMVMLQ
ncbi:MAG: PKD domain-containing protein [Candidatus Marinimicrobia bacterium]|nr:PKD domain-containing protein [FCB group bacterium]MBL7026230.1 PKD domain-containing protein [Candidatus Neomarinimicrobiota bacterium]